MKRSIHPALSGLGLTVVAAGMLAMTLADPPALNDAQIAHIAVTANQIDIDAARAALPRLRTRDAREFAEAMIRDHEAVIGQAVELAGKLGVTPEDNDVSRQLLDGAAEAQRKLAATAGARFERAYLEDEVAYHQAVIDAVEGTLIPNTRNGELRALLEAVVPALRGHLEHAKHLVANRT